MTTPTDSVSAYNELAAAIVKAVPEIMELKSGCRLRVGIQYNNWVMTLSDQMVEERPTRQDYIDEGGTNKWVVLSDKASTNVREILGRPITLEDVLRATKTGEINPLLGRPSEKRIDLAVGSFGELMRLRGSVGHSCWKDTGVNWNLGKPLSEQSPETISFLRSLFPL